MDIVVLGVVRLASAFTPWGTLKVMLTPLRHATPDHPPHLPPIRHPRARYLTRDATPPSDPPVSLAAPECTSPTSPESARTINDIVLADRCQYASYTSASTRVDPA